jgi:NDP-sugar pyrophosphorylase family protein
VRVTDQNNAATRLACILAAGEGTRLGATARTPKSMLPLSGRPLVDMQLDRLAQVGIEETVVVIRPEHETVISHLARRQDGPRVEVIQCASRGGAESLLSAAGACGGSAFVLCTVDSLFTNADLAGFREACQRQADSVALLSITRRRSDLPNDVGVSLDRRGRVLDIGKHLPASEFVCEGPMWCSSAFFQVAEEDMGGPSRSLTRLLRTLTVDYGRSLATHEISWAMDIDTLEDLKIAEKWTRSET